MSARHQWHGHNYVYVQNVVYNKDYVESKLKHTTTQFLFSLFDHYILSREWRIIVDQLEISYHGCHGLS